MGEYPIGLVTCRSLQQAQVLSVALRGKEAPPLWLSQPQGFSPKKAQLDGNDERT